ncbi:MAG: hypothetical protein FJ290_10850 [Planctomycetes bacterium]|nr:hypothetical protein [Planctomycetota bacterium]
MSRWAFSRCGLAMLLACAALAGCSTPVGKYFARRGADLADCVEAEVGLGWPAAPFLFPKAMGYTMEDAGGTPIRVENAKPRSRALALPNLYMRFKLTDYFVFGNGYAQPVTTGWRGRYRRAGSAVAVQAGLPIYRNHEEVAGTTVHTDWLVKTRRSYDAAKPGPGSLVAERSWLGLSATILVAFRLEFNLVELADALVGLSGYDLLKDDSWQRKEPRQ